MSAFHPFSGSTTKPAGGWLTGSSLHTCTSSWFGTKPDQSDSTYMGRGRQPTIDSRLHRCQESCVRRAIRSKATPQTTDNHAVLRPPQDSVLGTALTKYGLCGIASDADWFWPDSNWAGCAETAQPCQLYADFFLGLPVPSRFPKLELERNPAGLPQGLGGIRNLFCVHAVESSSVLRRPPQNAPPSSPTLRFPRSCTASRAGRRCS